MIGPVRHPSAATIAPATLRTRTLYRRIAPFYDTFRSAWSRLTLPVEQELDRLFREQIGQDTRILELAPGTGINIARLFREAKHFLLSTTLCVQKASSRK